MMENTADRVAAICAAQHLANALDALNRSGWVALDQQRDGYAYGEAHDALRIVVDALWRPAFTDRIIDTMYDSGVSIVTAARYVAENLVQIAGERLSDTYDAVRDVEDDNGDHDEVWENAWHVARDAYKSAQTLVENADGFLRQTHADCCCSFPLPTYG